jgi:6-pyruvoyltetrahydropterin/6-carboxytetrahydropterin synthase
MRASLTRRVTFAAAHRYRRPEWDEAKNAAVFGLYALPNYHGHNYAVELTVAGPIDATTGFIVDLVALDPALEREVMAPLDHKNLNLDVAEFADGKLIPTSENIAAWILARMQRALAGISTTATVSKVRVHEGPGLWAEVGTE